MAQSAQVKKVSWWHEQIVDWELQNPHRNLGDCARFFGVTQTYLSVLRNSDAFINYRAGRMGLHQENVSETVVANAQKLANISMEVLQERISRERKDIALGGVRDTAEMALKALGFGIPAVKGGNGNGGNSTEVTVNIVDSSALEAARQKMRQLQQQHPAQVSHSQITLIEEKGKEIGGVQEVLPSAT